MRYKENTLAMDHHVRLFCSLMLLSAAPLLAQELRSVGGRMTFGATFDHARQRVVMPSTGGYSYEWDGIAWHRTPDAGAQAGYCFMDASNDRLVSMWEVDPLGASSPVFAFHERVGHEWQPLQVPGGPGPRWGTGFVFDDQRGELVVFGGVYGPTFTRLSETWTFDGTSWTQHNPSTVPPARFYPSLCCDSVRQRVVMFGGAGGALLGDTWEWDGTDWAFVATATSPPARMGAPMAFDSSRGQALLLGHIGPQPALDFWEYDGMNWQQRTPPPIGLASRPRELVFDPVRNETLMLGYIDNYGLQGAVLAWDGSNWTGRPALGDFPSLGWLGGVALDHTGGEVLQFGGGGGGWGTPYQGQALSAWDGNNWQILSIAGPPARTGPAMWSMSNATFVFGGVSDSGAMLTDTWRWDGVNWIQMTPVVSPSARVKTAIAFHATQNLAVLFGGNVSNTLYGAFGDTWLFDGAVWQLLSGGVQPGARHSHSMAYDPLRDRVVMYGGVKLSPFAGGSTTYTDTWEHDGTSWSLVATGGAPPSSIGTMAYDHNRQRIVYLNALSSAGVELWEFDGATWSPLAVAGDLNAAHPLRLLEPIATTGPSGSLLIVGLRGAVALLPRPASAATYGNACSASAPQLTASQIPDIGESTFGIEVTLAPAAAPVVMFGADQDASLPILGCTMLVTPGVWAGLLASDAQGFARQALPLPMNPALLGANYYFQVAALDATAPNGFTLSRGLRITLGQ